MRQYLNILFLLTLALGLASCEEDDQYDIESIFIGRTWTGDVGMNAGNGEPLFSTFTFGGDGFGEEYQYYQSDGAPYEHYRFQWYWEDGFNRNLVLDYGRAGISYMDDVRISGNRMCGIFYFSDNTIPFDFELVMEIR
ncbi:hypothetical protein [Bacteroides gallinarum]|uniref:hypothetical protein n=1 Tax=Bacteroides gallinarum TaxID=376806 RepID=UPI00036FD99D|nr:hypothetical protein [Bacteroides gallinarum]